MLPSVPPTIFTLAPPIVIGILLIRSSRQLYRADATRPPALAVPLPKPVNTWRSHSGRHACIAEQEQEFSDTAAVTLRSSLWSFVLQMATIKDVAEQPSLHHCHGRVHGRRRRHEEEEEEEANNLVIRRDGPSASCAKGCV